MTFSEKILESAQEGIVLLKNDGGVLPLNHGETVSIFGRCQFDFYKCGMGSGGSVRAPYSTNLTDNVPCADKELAEIYRSWIRENPFDSAGGGWAAEPFFQKEMVVTKELAENAAKKSGKAIFVIGRNAGEDKDLIAEKGAWFLTDDEKNSIREICKFFKDVIIIFNTCGIIDTSWIFEKEFSAVKAVLYAWQGGQEGGRACAKIITGDSVPSGKLSDTIAKKISDYPSTKNFGTQTKAFYEEDIFVGYRYFSTFAKEKILFPFGFGLSYTSFDVKFVSSEISGDGIKIRASVKNSGEKFSGKEVVQIYFEAPQGKLGKPSRQLAAFKKSRLLKPGESEELELEFKIAQMASYDDSGKSGFKNAFVLESGNYFFYLGTDSLSAEKIPCGKNESFSVEKTFVTEQLEAALMPEEKFSRLTPGEKKSDGNFSEEKENVPLMDYDLKLRIEKNLPAEIPFTGDRGIRFDDVKNDLSKLDDFVAQLSPKQLATLVRGEGMMSRKATPGIASVLGGVSEDLHALGIPVAGCSDGPSGIRLDTGKEASLMPVGTLLACSWNPDLVEELFEFEGEEIRRNEIDTILGPGINIHRNPLNGRNFEYFSEDPLLTGKITVAVLKGAEKKGVICTIKHFACNSQETQRRTHDSIVSERALREIYLKPFEIAVKEGGAKSIMTSYNSLNGHFTAGNYDLAKTILRKQWKYDGLVMTDWWANVNDCVQKGSGNVHQVASMVRSQNDAYMIVDNDAAEKNGNDDDISESLANGKLTVAELQVCAKDVIRFLTRSLVADRPLRDLDNIPSFSPVIAEIPSGEKAVEENVRFLCNGCTRRIFHAGEDGVYNVIGVYSKPADEKTVSQSVCNVLVDKNPTFAFECRSTEGKETAANIGQIRLKKGLYEISLLHTKPGIEIIFVALSREITTSSAVEYFPNEGESRRENPFRSSL